MFWQEEAVALLCSMAAFPFYRPAIRNAAPAGALTSMLEAGCSPVSLPVVLIVALLCHASICGMLCLAEKLFEFQGAKIRLAGSRVIPS